ncbi:MAG: phage integrase SAM-like domain-containing protein, partial [Bacteroidota bacterium]
MEKKFLPCRLVTSNPNRWYLTFSQVNEDGNLERFNRTYGLNRIKDKKLRRERARQLRKEINAELPFGYPFTDTAERHYKALGLLEAIQLALKIQCTGVKKRTAQSYESTVRKLVAWLRARGLSKLRVNEFKVKHCFHFSDYMLITEGLTPTSHNTNMRYLKGLFNILADREYIDANPFLKIKAKREAQKKRRSLNEQEKAVIAEAARKENPTLYVNILLMYYCAIRPLEIISLKAEDFDLENNKIRITQSNSKGNRLDFVSIPDEL